MNSFTPNYNLDLYDLDDKPNLNDQYNAAVTKVDTELSKQANDIVTAETAVANLNTKVEGYDGRITANTAAITKLQTDVATAQTTAENGVTAAHEANELAVQASSAAQTAQTTAENGVTAAHEANELAVQASSAAQTAQTIANQANAAASSAQADATKALAPKYMVTMGDSWVQRDNGDFTAPLAAQLGYRLQNVAVSGAGFTTNNNFISQTNAITAPADSIDLVLVLGGVNDVRAGATSVSSQIPALVSAIKAKAPKAKIIIVGSQNVPSVNASLTYKYTSALAAACAQAGVGFISMFGWFIGMTGIWDTTQLHLTNTASTTILVSKLISYIFGDGSSDVRESTLTLNNTVSDITITEQRVYCNDDYAVISLDLTISAAKGIQTILCPTPYGGKESYGLVVAKSSASNVTYCYVGESGSLVLGEINPAGAGSFKLFITIPFI